MPPLLYYAVTLLCVWGAWRASAIPLEIVAGTLSTPGYSGDGAAATLATINQPYSVATTYNSGTGAVRHYIADKTNHRIRLVSVTGIITTIAGTGSPGFSGDDAAATAAELNSPNDVAALYTALTDSVVLFIADTGNHRIRKIDTAGIITTIAGRMSYGYGDDNVQATLSWLWSPSGVSAAYLGGSTTPTVYIADTGTHRVRVVNEAGIITTLAGVAGDPGFVGEGTPSTSAKVNAPERVLAFYSPVDAAVLVFIADTGNHRIRKIDGNGDIYTYAGNSAAGFNIEYGDATMCSLHEPRGMAIAYDSSMMRYEMYFADTLNQRIRRVGYDNLIATVMGSPLGDAGSSGDPSSAESHQVNYPRGASAFYRSGGDVEFYVADTENAVIWRIGMPLPSAPVTPSPSATVTPSATPSVSPTPSNSITPSGTSSVSATPSSTASPTPTSSTSSSPSNSATPTPSNSATPTASQTASSTPSNTGTTTPSNSATPTPSNTASGSASSSVTPTSTGSTSTTPSNSATPTPSNSASSSPSSTSTPTPSSTSTPTSSNSASGTPSNTASGTPSTTPSGTPSITASVSATNTASSTPSTSGTSTPSNSATPTSSNSASSTPSNTGTATPSNSASTTSSNSASPTPSHSGTTTPSNSATPTSSNSASGTPSNSASATPSNSGTPTPSNSASGTPSTSATPTPSNSASGTPSNSASITPSNSATPTSSNSASSTASVSPSITASITATNSASNSPSNSGTPTPSNSASSTPSVTSTTTPSNSASSTASNSGTATASTTSTSTPSNSASGTPSVTPSMTQSSTASVTATNSVSGTPSTSATTTPSSTSSFSMTPSVTATASAMASGDQLAISGEGAGGSELPSTFVPILVGAIILFLLLLLAALVCWQRKRKEGTPGTGRPLQVQEGATSMNAEPIQPHQLQLV